MAPNQSNSNIHSDRNSVPASGRKGPLARLAIIAGVVVLADQITKAIVLQTMPLYSQIPVIPGFFNLTHIHNPGGAFGFLASYGGTVRQVAFIMAALVAMGLVLYFYMKIPATYTFLSGALALIFGGALGNLIDRFRFGKVVDFLDFYVQDLHWPAFNVADSAITVGIIIFGFHLVFKKVPDL